MLFDNTTNPFNSTTTISYYAPENQHIILRIYNIIGQQVATLVNCYDSAGYHTVEWDGVERPSGIFFYMLEANGYTETKKMLLVK